MSTKNYNCETLVIGSGPGGATTAVVLAQAGIDVLVLEEGPESPKPPLKYSLEEMNERYRFGGLCIAWGNPKTAYLEGCCLGGASEVNAGLYVRPLASILDSWSTDHDLKDFGSAALERYFKENETALNVQLMQGDLGIGSRILARGAKPLKWASSQVPRMWDYSVNKPHGQGMTMGRSFIPQAKQAGARFISRIKVKRLLHKSSQAYLALALDMEKGIEITVNFKSVFVCAGAIQTPLLLQKSGIKRNIGQHLRMHPAVRVVALYDQQASDPQEGVPVEQISEFKPELTLGGSFSSPAHLALWLAGRKDFNELMRRPQNLGIFYALIRAKGHGQIRPMPMADEALVTMHFPDEDLGAMGQGLYRLGQLLFASGAKRIFSPVDGHLDYSSLKDMEGLNKGLPRRGVDLSTIHLFSSCPMGENPANSAVDSFGRVHGMTNIYLNDASILPDAPGSNPQALIMAIARRNIQHWIQKG